MPHTSPQAFARRARARVPCPATEAAREAVALAGTSSVSLASRRTRRRRLASKPAEDRNHHKVIDPAQALAGGASLVVAAAGSGAPGM